VRVLLLCQVLPYPPDSGAKLKTWNLIKWLGARYDLTLVAFARQDPVAAIEALRHHCRAVHTTPMRRGAARDTWALARALAAGEPWLITRDSRRAMHALVRQVARDGAFDVVHVDQLNMAQYAAPIEAPTVLDAHNALWLLCERLAAGATRGWRRLLLRREAQHLRAYEGAVGRRCDALVCVSETDRRAWQQVAGASVPITVIPIGIDADELTPLPRRPSANRVVHIGTMFWPPNVDAVRWFLEEVWPRILAARPDAACDIIGAEPPRTLRNLAASTSSVQLHGYVSDPRPLLANAGAVVVPLLAGSGMRVKILTALAHGLPVVSTTIGCEGIDVEPGRDLLVADGAADFAAAALRLLDEPELAAALGRNGRRLIEQRYDYRRVLAPLAALYAAARRAAEGQA
jgi:glycosyltransferase involved in cell wall biosynthesis